MTRSETPLSSDDSSRPVRPLAAGWLLFAALNAALAVAAGAYAAHGLEAAGARAAALAGTASQYQMWHALALIAVVLLRRQAPAGGPTRALALAGWAFSLGMVLFCGALYVTALAGPSALGGLAPFGGTAFLVGWAALAGAAVLWARRADRS